MIIIKRVTLKLTSFFAILFSLFSLIGSYSFTDEYKEFNWYFVRSTENPYPDSPKETKEFQGKHNDYYLGDTNSKVIYLTFDEGYEREGNTNKILDTLKETNVPAAFFVVKPYIVQHPEIVKRMYDEGHLVCNHSSHHPSMASVKDKNKFIAEFTEVEEEYKKLTSQEMPKFFRPPMGKFSIYSLKETTALGYKTIFWSFAYKDWIPDQQPGEEYAKKKIVEGAHPGCIMLLHAVSDTNVKVLKDVITQLQADGYEFKPLSDLPGCQ